MERRTITNSPSRAISVDVSADRGSNDILYTRSAKTSTDIARDGELVMVRLSKRLRLASSAIETRFDPD